MKTFKEYRVIIEAKNTHMTHIEDSVLYGGVNGTREAIFALRSLRDMLAGSGKDTHDVTLKWDGAPAVFAGIDPSDGKFFVAKKGIFNKNPKVYKSEADVDADTSGDLAEKLKVAFRELSKLGIEGVIQGDIMFTKADINTENINGDKYITFQPNTIVYAVPVGTKLAKDIKAAEIGVVFHTAYHGKDFASMNASFDVDASKLKKTKSVWFQDAKLRDLTGKAIFTAKETDEVTEALSDAGKIFQKIAGTTLKTLGNDRTLAGTLETFNNTLVRRGEKINSPAKHVNALIDWIDERFAKETDQRKSEKGKDAVQTRRNNFMEFFSPENKKNLVLVYQLQNAIIHAKKLIMDKLDTLKKMNTFVRKTNGFEVTGDEGFVVIDKLSSGALKLVDRLEFSSANFSKDTIKGWER